MDKMQRREHYQRMKRRTRNTAIFFSDNFEKATEEIPVCEWTAYFRKLGKRYGLTKEFEENGII